MQTISVAIMTKNEAANIEACINSAKWVDEIIVLDCGSTDDTQAICKRCGVNLVVTDWQGFGEQCNRALKLAKSDWCFLLDADERITDELRSELQSILSKPAGYVAYKIPRKNFFLGRSLHCLSPKSDRPLKLVKKGCGSFTDVVHQTPVINGPIGVVKNHMLHYPFRDVGTLLEKANYYSTLSVQKLSERNVKSSVSKALLHASWAFIKFYFLKGGFLDGWPGFLIAFSNCEGALYRYAKLLEHQKQQLKIKN
jgi:glycosyltransferase involved in cell wall biosynthesis